MYLRSIALGGLAFLLGCGGCSKKLPAPDAGVPGAARPEEADAGAQIAVGASPDGLWLRGAQSKAQPSTAMKFAEAGRDVRATYRLSPPVLGALHARVSPKSADAETSAPVEISLPTPAGTFETFRLEPSHVFAPQLEARFPELKTFVGRSLRDPRVTAAVHVTRDDLGALVRSEEDDFVVGRPGPAEDHIVVSRGDSQRSRFRCLVDDTFLKSAGARPQRLKKLKAVPLAPDDTHVREYRIAIATSGEYARAVHSPGDLSNPGADQVSDALNAIGITLNRVNLIYESELGIRLRLIADNDKVVFTDPDKDPYSNDDPHADLPRNQETLDKLIGTKNYDVGHLFTTGSGGLARLYGPCNAAFKARGTTGRSDPWGDTFDVDYVAHELGHQFGANHTFGTAKGSCGRNRNDATAFEPGSGSTIMAYAGICGDDDLQPNSDDYFHAISLKEIEDYVQETSPGWGGSCPSRVASANANVPVVTAPSEAVIPPATPFRLAAVASDPDQDRVWCTWEQFGAPAHFRSARADESCSRTIPAFARLVGGPVNGYDAERLLDRDGTFVMRVTARDRRGKYASRDVKIRVADRSAGGQAIRPFKVLAPAADSIWTPQSDLLVKWDVAGTSLAPIACAQVRIALVASNSGAEVAVLAANTANDGSERIAAAPALSEGAFHVAVECLTQPFFAVSRARISVPSK